MRLRSSKYAFILLIIQGFPLLATGAPPDKEEVLANMVRAYGGEENLEKLNHMNQLWKMNVQTSGQEGHDYRVVLQPTHLLVELMYPNRMERRLLRGAEAYRSMGESPYEQANPMQKEAMMLQLMRLYSPLTLRDRQGDLALTDTEDYLVLSLIEGDIRADYLVNKENWRIEKVAGTLTINGMSMQFLTEYSDFRVVDGVLMHHQERKFAGNVNTANLELLKLHSDPDLSLANFPDTRPDE